MKYKGKTREQSIGKVQGLRGRVAELEKAGEIRKKEEEALRRRETRLNEAQRIAHIGSWELDLVNNILTWSDEIYHIFEIDPKRFGASYEAFLDSVHPEDRAAVDSAYTTSIKNRTPYSIDHRLKFSDGRIKYVHEQGETLYGADSRAIRSLGTVQDITERKQAEEALRLATAYNRSLIEASLDPLVTIGPDGKITDVNSATEMVTGYPRKELIGRDFADYFADPDKAREGYRQAFREGSVRDYALDIRHRDGRLTPVLYNASVYRDEAGNVIGVFAAARDITEEKRAMEMLKEQQRAFMEVSVPVVNIWHRILLVPLIGVFDSKRAQLVMETLLSSIEETQAKVAILDISGIPVMDTLVAKYLLRTVAATRLMGTECIITGIRSAISQTIVHLGVDLSGVVTKTTLDEGIKRAFDLTGMKVVSK